MTRHLESRMFLESGVQDKVVSPPSPHTSARLPFKMAFTTLAFADF